jgi:hypothetical protein
MLNVAVGSRTFARVGSSGDNVVPSFGKAKRHALAKATVASRNDGELHKLKIPSQVFAYNPVPRPFLPCRSVLPWSPQLF